MAQGKTYDTAEKRWEGVGPYYAMFPIHFADAVIQEYTAPGDSVLDPFAGRGTAVFSAASSGRTGIGIEISPVGWVYGKAKLNSVPYIDVESRVLAISRYSNDFSNEARRMPKFFLNAFQQEYVAFYLLPVHSLIGAKMIVTEC
ncbi:MAG: hypothetical protein LUF87_04030 [Alistipes sp.]|nr:hypothetical protein [Alistipes sp.]